MKPQNSWTIKEKVLLENSFDIEENENKTDCQTLNSSNTLQFTPKKKNTLQSNKKFFHGSADMNLLPKI